MIKRTLYFNSIPSTDAGLVVESGNILDSAEYDYETFEIPGMNGSLTAKNYRFKDKELTYVLATVREIIHKSVRIGEWLTAHPAEYLRLEDSATPDYFYKAMFNGPIGYETTLLKLGKASVEFIRKPQRFFKTGEEITTLSSGSLTLINPSKFTAKPLIRVYGYGTLEVGDNQITIASGSNSYIDIDSEVERCYEGSEARDSLVSLTDHKYPVFDAGSTTIKISGNITKAEIMPRWWTI